MATLIGQRPEVWALTCGLLVALASGTRPQPAPSPSAPGGTGSATGHAAAPPSATEPAGPFGLAMGMSRDDVERATRTTLSPSREQPSAFTSTSVPRPHDAFGSYSFLITDTHGLCRIAAIGRDIDTNAFGTEVQAEFAALQTALTAKYGKPVLRDFVQRGSIWTEPQDWTMGVLQGERVLAAVWTYARPRPSDHVSAVSLGVKALSPSKAYVTLTYEFENTVACRKEIAAAQNAVL